MSIAVSNDALYCSVLVLPTVWAVAPIVKNNPNNTNKFFIHYNNIIVANKITTLINKEVYSGLM